MLRRVVILLNCLLLCIITLWSTWVLCQASHCLLESAHHPAPQ
jgi:hypothetical protein